MWADHDVDLLQTSPLTFGQGAWAGGRVILFFMVFSLVEVCLHVQISFSFPFFNFLNYESMITYL